VRLGKTVSSAAASPPAGSTARSGGIIGGDRFLPCATPKEREGSAKPEGKKVSHEDTKATKMERPARPAARHLRGFV
jgi:hypothetical protein